MAFQSLGAKLGTLRINQQWSKALPACLFFACALPNLVQALKANQKYPEIKCQSDASFSHSLYLPNGYGSQEAHLLVLTFDPASRSNAPLELLRQARDQFGYILTCSSDTGNLVSSGENLKAAKTFWQDVATRIKVNRQRTYTA